MQQGCKNSFGCICGNFPTFVPMKQKTYENVKLPAPIVDKLRANKKKTKVPIISFVVLAIEEKLKSQNKS